MFFFIVYGFACPRAFAVVGNAERYDEFKEEDLKEYHESLVREEQQMQMDRATEFLGEEMPSDAELALTGDSFEAAESSDIRELRENLLRLPKKDRVAFGFDGMYKYNTNIDRRIFQEEKGDSVFEPQGTLTFDLGGKKTNLTTEFRSGQQFNIRFPQKNFWMFENRIRARRRLFKKMTNSIQSRIGRHSEGTVEIDQQRRRWDSVQNYSVNYNLSRKFSVNGEVQFDKRVFTTEAFDQDSQRGLTLTPSLFWHITPKSRFQAGYTYGYSRKRAKVGDSDANEFRLGYFGRITRKSSASFDIAWSFQRGRSHETPDTSTLTIGTGYVWQMTPKTQMNLQLIRKVQNTTSNSTGAVVSQGDVDFTNDSISVSFNSRLRRKLTGIFRINLSHVKNRVDRTGDEESETTTLTLPVSLTLNYELRRWMQVQFDYTFAYRQASEERDRYRLHELITRMIMQF